MSIPVLGKEGQKDGMNSSFISPSRFQLTSCKGMDGKDQKSKLDPDVFRHFGCCHETSFFVFFCKKCIIDIENESTFESEISYVQLGGHLCSSINV